MRIPFKAQWRDAMLTGKKICTSRTKRYGNEGDTFEVFGHTFALIGVEKQTLSWVANNLFYAEGCDTPEAFRRVWDEIHPRRGYVGNDTVWVHYFEEVTL